MSLSLENLVSKMWGYIKKNSKKIIISSMVLWGISFIFVCYGEKKKYESNQINDTVYKVIIEQKEISTDHFLIKVINNEKEIPNINDEVLKQLFIIYHNFLNLKEGRLPFIGSFNSDNINISTILSYLCYYNNGNPEAGAKGLLKIVESSHDNILYILCSFLFLIG